jgi:hypothetical protein
MFFKKKETETPNIVPSQNFKQFAKELEETLVYQFHI